MLRGLCRLASTLKEWELVALLALSMGYGLRAKEVFTAFYNVDKVVWTGAKGCRGRCAK